MAKITPFKGLLYNPSKIKELAKVMAPPYDIISPQLQGELYKAHQYNVVRLILGKEFPDDNSRVNKYTRAAEYLKHWTAKGILKEDPKSVIYVYKQQFLHQGMKKERLGFIALLKFEEPHRRAVLPHEKISPEPKLDRFKLIKTVEANLCPIFSLYQDPKERINKILRDSIAGSSPCADLNFRKVRHSLWRIDDADVLARIVRLMRNKKVYIADGHHRYEATLSFCNSVRKKARVHTGREDYNYVMSYFASLADKGLAILATHRVVKKLNSFSISELKEKLAEFFVVKEFKQKKRLFQELHRKRKETGIFGLYLGKRRYYLLGLKAKKALDKLAWKGVSRNWRNLDVFILHEFVFRHILKLKEKFEEENNIVYTSNAQAACRMVDSKKFEATFFLNPTRVNQVKRIAQANEKMPQKSTYFYPKLLTGLVINKYHFEKVT